MSYIFVLGRNQELSRAELTTLCAEADYDSHAGLWYTEKLPQDDPQGFLDRLGGTIRIAEVLGTYRNEPAAMRAMADRIQEQKPEGKIHLGLSIFGRKQTLLRTLCRGMKNNIRTWHDRNVRTVNRPGQNLDSGMIFAGKLLEKGFEFLLHFRGGDILVAQTVAVQNLDKYTLRDRKKPFRDSKMGMLPPKLAQILINLADPQPGEMVVDPFCGSATVNIEAALMGFRTHGQDLKKDFVAGAEKNIRFLASRMAFDPALATFSAGDVRQLPQEAQRGVLVTEGYLGTNFEESPSQGEIERNKREIEMLWKKIFEQLQTGAFRKVVFCLPMWRRGRLEISIAPQVLAGARQAGFSPQKPFAGRQTFVYARGGAYVGREICVVEGRNQE